MKNIGLTNFLPEAATEIATRWDELFYFLIGVSVFFFVPIIVVATIFVFKYRSKKHKKVEDIHGHTPLEIFWTIIPTIIVLFIFGWGWFVYVKMTHAPKDAFEIKVIGKQWLWQFNYDNGKTTIGELNVPVNQRIKLIMTSDDVIHSFFVPDFRTKNDVVPGLYTSIWFEPTTVGEHRVYCSEYCGGAHSSMLAKINVMPEDEWLAWYQKSSAPSAEDLALPPAELGAKLAQDKGCVACHSADGSVAIGPSFKNLWGKQEEMADGSTQLVDANYIREHIEYPDKGSGVKGFPRVMPSFRGLLTEQEIMAIIEYIKSLK